MRFLQPGEVRVVCSVSPGITAGGIMRKLLLAGALFALLPVTAQAANFYQWPGIWFQANPPDTYSTVLILTSGAHCPGRAGPGTPVSAGFDGNTGERVYTR